MRKLSAKSKAFAADKLGIAHAHFKVAEKLHLSGSHGASVARAYYAAYFAAQASLADLGSKSTTHKFWVNRFNKRFGTGRSWVPKTYVKTLNELSALRKTYDYHGSLPDNFKQAKSMVGKVSKLLKKVIDNTPLLNYPEFIENIISDFEWEFGLEFDYYCPKSYIHKDRVQLQIMGANYDQHYCRKIKLAGKRAIATLDASRQEDYVLGWNNRLGQNADAYLLFLDIDTDDEPTVKAALSGRKGWLFKSGNGFHFVGAEIFTSTKQWMHRFEKAANSKKLRHLVDPDHVKFSMRRGYSTLRISASPTKPFTPFQCLDQT